METIVSKKTWRVAKLHFVTAGVMALSIVGLLIGIFSEYFFVYTGPTEEFQGLGHGIAAALSIIGMIISMSAMLLTIPAFLFSGKKLKRQAMGELPSKKSFVITLVAKTITFFLIALPLLILFSLENGWLAAVIHIVVLAFSLASSLLEAYVRRKP